MAAFDPIYAVDPNNSQNVAENGVISIYAPNTRDLLTLKTVTGGPLSNPLQLNARGFGPAFIADGYTLVAWEAVAPGEVFQGTFKSYEGVLEQAVAAKVEAAEGAASELAQRIAAGEFRGEDGQDGSNVIPTAEAIATEIQTPGTAANTALSATFADQIALPGSPTNLALQARGMLNILDFDVVRGTQASQTTAIKAALDSKPGKAFYFPPGDYRIDTDLVVSQANTLVLADDARVYAGAAMNTLITYLWNGPGYAEDKGITGGKLDGNLLAQRILSITKVIRFTLTRTTFKDGINRGLVTESGPGAEVFAYDIRFHNTGVTNVVDNIAIEANMKDCHFSDIVMRDWTVGVKDTAGNRWSRVHPWISPDNANLQQLSARYPTSIAFDITGSSNLTETYADTCRTAYKIRSNGTAFTPVPHLTNCTSSWTSDVLTPTLANANPAYGIDNTEGVGVVTDGMKLSGHSTATTLPVFLRGPATNVTARNTYNNGFVSGIAEYLNGIVQGLTTFTPTIYGSSGAGAHSYTAQVGRMVVSKDTTTYFVRIRGTLDATTAFSGALRIGGLPIPSGATHVRDGAGSIGYAVGINASSVVVFANTTPYISVMSNQGTTVGIQETDVAGQALRGKTIDLILNVEVVHYKA